MKTITYDVIVYDFVKSSDFPEVKKYKQIEFKKNIRRILNRTWLENAKFFEHENYRAYRANRELVLEKDGKLFKKMTLPTELTIPGEYL
jgi:hypothetical protein